MLFLEHALSRYIHRLMLAATRVDEYTPSMTPQGSTVVPDMRPRSYGGNVVVQDAVEQGAMIFPPDDPDTTIPLGRSSEPIETNEGYIVVTPLGPTNP